MVGGGRAASQRRAGVYYRRGKKCPKRVGPPSKLPYCEPLIMRGPERHALFQPTFMRVRASKFGAHRGLGEVGAYEGYK